MLLNKRYRRIITLLVIVLIAILAITAIRKAIIKYQNNKKVTKIERQIDKIKSKERFNLIIKDKIIDTSDFKTIMTNDDIYISTEEVTKLLNGSGQWNSETGKYILNCFNRYSIIDTKNRKIENSKGAKKNIRIVGRGKNKRISFLDIMDSFDYKTTRLYDTQYYWSRPLDYEIMPIEIADKYKDVIGFKLDNYKSKYIRERKEFEERFPEKKKETKMREIPSKKTIYITINDGPDQYTEDIVDALKRSKINATFFFTGRNMKKNKELVQKVYGSGNSIGIQGMTGRSEIVYSSIESFINEMESGEKELEDIININSKLIRPIYGSYPNMTKGYRDIAIKNGYRIWDWNIDATKFGTDPEVVCNYILDNIKENKVNIILFESNKHVSETISFIVKELKEKRNYNFDIITEDLYPRNFWNDQRIELK